MKVCGGVGVCYVTNALLIPIVLTTNVIAPGEIL